jgi:hypothetical protein
LLFVVKEIFLFLLLPLLHSFFFQQKEEEEDEEGLAVDFVKVAHNRDEEVDAEDAIIIFNSSRGARIIKVMKNY